MPFSPVGSLGGCESGVRDRIRSSPFPGTEGWRNPVLPFDCEMRKLFGERNPGGLSVGRSARGNEHYAMVVGAEGGSQAERWSRLHPIPQ